MKHEVDKLVANILLTDGEVYLPRVGTLILVRRAARRLSSKVLQRPYRELCLTTEQRGESLVTHMARVAGVGEERATDIYNEYVTQSLREGVFTIENLCSIKGATLQTFQQFEDMANPKGRGVVKVNPRTNYFIYVVAGLCAGFALGVAGYVLHSNGAFDFGAKMATKVEVAEVAVPVTAEVVAPIEQVAEPAVESAAEGLAEPVVEESVAMTTQPLQRGMSYAVWGVYNELANGQEALAWLGEKYPDIEARVYEYDGRYMVALCELPSRSACGRQVSAWKAERAAFKNVWVYTR